MCKNRSNLPRFMPSILALVVTVNFIISNDMIYNPRLISQCRYTVYTLSVNEGLFFFFLFLFFAVGFLNFNHGCENWIMYILEEYFIKIICSMSFVVFGV